MIKRTIRNTAAVVTIRLLLAMCLTIVIVSSVSWAGDIFQRFGCAETYCTRVFFAFLIEILCFLRSHDEICVLQLVYEQIPTIFLFFTPRFGSKDTYVALKVIKSAEQYTETAADEIRLLEAIRLNESRHHYCEKIVRLLNNFTIRGVNGIHTCLVFEALGCSLYKLLVKHNFQGLPIKMVKSILRQILQGLHFLHTHCGIIHTDIKPENILVCLENSNEINRQIDNEITSLKERNIRLPVSYGN